MKQSFRGLAARASLPAALWTCLVMTVIEAGLFRILGWNAGSLEDAFAKAGVALAFVIALSVLHASFCLRGALGAKSALPYARLGLPRRQLLRLQAEQNALCFFLLWAWQALAALALAAWWCRAHPDASGAHTIFVATYRVSLLHAVLPMGDWLLWLRNLAVCLALGVCAAKAALTRRATGPMIVGVLAAIFFPVPAGGAVYIAILQIAILFVAASFSWMDGGSEPNAEEA